MCVARIFCGSGGAFRAERTRRNHPVRFGRFGDRAAGACAVPGPETGYWSVVGPGSGQRIQAPSFTPIGDCTYIVNRPPCVQCLRLVGGCVAFRWRVDAASAFDIVDHGCYIARHDGALRFLLDEAINASCIDGLRLRCKRGEFSRAYHEQSTSMCVHHVIASVAISCKDVASNLIIGWRTLFRTAGGRGTGREGRCVTAVKAVARSLWLPFPSSRSQAEPRHLGFPPATWLCIARAPVSGIFAAMVILTRLPWGVIAGIVALFATSASVAAPASRSTFNVFGQSGGLCAEERSALGPGVVTHLAAGSSPQFWALAGESRDMRAHDLQAGLWGGDHAGVAGCTQHELATPPPHHRRASGQPMDGNVKEDRGILDFAPTQQRSESWPQRVSAGRARARACGSGRSRCAEDTRRFPSPMPVAVMPTFASGQLPAVNQRPPQWADSSLVRASVSWPIAHPLAACPLCMHRLANQ